ncbi:MAG: putative PEP-binding protein, partial [Acidobacteriota bacterium]
GGMTSHAAVVARGMGKSCVVGCSEIRIESDTRQMTLGNRVIREGEEISIDGSTGEVFLGRLLTRESVVHQALMDGKSSGEPNPLVESFTTLMKWVDSTRRLRVRANADTPENAREALAYGAEGIGLARTEHMFFALERIPTVQEMILASTTEERRQALAKLLPMQREDFGRILEAMDGLPVTIRLLDPPLHEFLPRHSKAQEKLAKTLKVSPEIVKAKVESLQEINPMLGHRGCRMGITYPEIYRTQVQAIFEAACALKRKGKDPRPEVMIPLVGIPEEFKRLRRLVVQEAERIMTRDSVRLPLIIGTMMEIPRACLVASEIAAEADFFSFGTNDLTQMTFGYSRDDSGGFLRAYQELGVLEDDPFQVLDRSGVGRLVEIATREGKKRRSDLKVGICGEHGGDPRSVQFFHSVGLDYVSCSSFRLPIARLAAARAALESGRNQTERKGRA